jgi:hypothetical protein
MPISCHTRGTYWALSITTCFPEPAGLASQLDLAPLGGPVRVTHNVNLARRHGSLGPKMLESLEGWQGAGAEAERHVRGCVGSEGGYVTRARPSQLWFRSPRSRDYIRRGFSEDTERVQLFREAGFTNPAAGLAWRLK